MKKFLSILCGAILTASVGTAVYAGENASVTVSIADENGKLAVAGETITVHDADGDGSVTVNDAMIVAHDTFYKGGSELGYEAAESDWGLSMNRLWGAENGGSYGYYVNSAAAFSLADPIANGDYVDAFVYTDLEAWSDTYCYFDNRTVSGSSVDLTLNGAGYDADWNPITVPIVGAEITLNGEKTGVLTDENGRATVDLPEGRCVISAVSDSQILVPPVAISDNEPTTAAQTGDLSVVLAAAAVLSLGAAVIAKKHSDEK